MPRGQRKKKAPRFPYALGAAAALALLGGVLFLYAERRIAPLLSGDFEGDYTSRVFSSPLSIRVKDPLSPAELRERLKRLGYLRVEGLPAQGQYRETGTPDGAKGPVGDRAAALDSDHRAAVFTVYPRGFDHPFVKATPSRVAVELQGSEVRSLRLAASDAPMLEAVLEPQLLYEVSGPRRVRRRPLGSEDIPPAMAQALVAVEDRRFYRHGGLDPRSILRAAWRDVRSLRKAEGASTLTQQLARGLFLTQDRTFSRKFKEALIALYLEARLSKPEILRLYLDSVYFGQDGATSVVGLTAAARTFFDKEPKSLSLGESALLAGIVNAPNRYNPVRNPEEAARRRKVVLAAMREEGFISRGTELTVGMEPLRVNPVRRQAGGEADYFLAYVQRKLEEEDIDRALLTRGLTVFTTLDPLLQSAAQRAVGQARSQAALVALDPRTGAVRALVGGKDYVVAPFDRATLAKRQPGSAFKPFVYGAALRAGGSGGRWTPAALLSDTTRTFRTEEGPWSPRNDDRVYRGPVPLRTALALSLNAATADLMSAVGPRAVIDYARDMGIVSPMRPRIGLALGISEVSLLELTAAYAPFANGGFRVDPFGVEAVLDAQGRVVEYHRPEPRQVLSPAESHLMTSLLREVVATGTARSLQRSQPALARVAAGKTGTTDDGKDAWFVGYTPRLVAGVWAGADKPTALGLKGATEALPIWAEFMAGTSAPASAEQAWPRPEGLVAARIDPASGLLAVMGCPRSREELFLEGTAPTKDCPLHSGGIAGWLKKLFRREPKPKAGHAR